MAMIILYWITLAALGIAAIVLLLRGRVSFRLGIVLLAAMACQTISNLVGDTPVGRTLLIVSIPLMIWAWFLTVRQVRAQWRDQMERVKHL